MKRRALLETSAAAAMSAMLVPATVRGANDRLAYGVIGTGREKIGGRGRYLNSIFMKLGAQCAALCEIYDVHLELARREAPQARTYPDYHDLLARRDLDFVVIATPDHHHYPMLSAALAAGKDVYLEKPLSHSLEESAKMVAAVRKSRQIVQVGTQRRSAPLFQHARKFIQEGAIGRINMVKVTWNSLPRLQLDNSPLPGNLDWKRFLGNAPQRPLEPRRFRWWRVFWDYSGGTITDMGCHLMDVVQWLCASRPPVSAVCEGKVVAMPGSETPDVFTCAFEYPGFIASFTMNSVSSYQNGMLIEFQGERGTLVLDGSGFRIYKEPWSAAENREPAYSERGGLPMEPHLQNFLDCIRTRRDPICPIEEGANGVAGLHLANLAFRKGMRANLK